MKHLIVLLTILTTTLLISGCNSSEEKKEKLTPLNTQSPLVIHTKEEQEQKVKEKKILNKIGIDIHGEKIVIDTNKTKNFLENMANILNKEAKKFDEKTKNIDEDDIGIKVNNEKIEIDTKKTKNFLEQFSKELEDIANNINKEISK